MTASPAARLVGGLLAGTGRLHDALAVDDVVAELAQLRDSPSYWVPTMFTDDTALQRRAQEIGRPLARWAPPDPTVLDSVAAVLDEGWQRAELQPGWVWAPPALRFEVGSFDELRELQQLGEVDGWRIVGSVFMRAGRVSWSWPLRVTAPDAAALDALRATLQYDRHYRVVEAAEGDVVEVVVVSPGTVEFVDHVLASVAIVIDSGSFDPGELLDRARRIGLAGVLLVPESPATGFIDALARELSHDEPLDVAASILSPASVLVASPELLGITSIRTWAGFVADRIDPASGVGEQLRNILRGAPFDHESGGGEAALDATGTLPEDELRSVSTIELQMAAAEPPSEDPVPREIPEIDLGEEPAAPPEAPTEPTADARRLQAKVTDASGAVREDAFLAGQLHQLRLRIAKEAAPGVIVADAVFRNPVPGQTVDLTVVVRVRGAKGKPKRRTLELPASVDSKWTSPIPIDVGAATERIDVEIVVLHEGRAVQTAVLSGQVVAAADESKRLTLSVDADTPPASIAGRTPTATTILVGTDVDGEPAVLDLSVSGRLLPADRLDKAAKAIRRILLDTFLAPPDDLRGAAGPLTKLAVWGATLRNQLKTGAGGFHDDDPWVHVVSFGDALVPFELIYTHKMPDSDDEVPVCDTALAGAKECAAGCPDRTRSDVVCPFGFWATSKVVERRVHVDNRTRATAAVQRKIAVISGAVVGTSNKADEQDNTSSQRIATSVAAAVPADRFRRVMTWKELAEAVDAGRPGIVVLVTHTIESPNPEVDLSVQFELGGDVKPAHRIDDSFVNPGLREPGPVVVSLGCDTGGLDVGFADWVATLHAAGAEVVVSTLSPVPGKEVALFIERLFTLLPREFDGPPPHRFGEVLTAVRRATVATGDVLAPVGHGVGRRRCRAGGRVVTLTVDMLPAKYGDALLVTWGTKSKLHRMLIDGGLGSAFPAVKAKLEEFDGPIELFVVTHVDVDHIGGAVKLLRDKTLLPRFGEVWFNGFQHLEKFNDLLGPIDGERLSTLIRDSGLRWNSGWPDPVDDEVGGPVVCRDVPPVVELAGGATLTVIGPSPQKLADLLPVWREVIEKAGLVKGVKPTDDPPAPGRGLLGASLADLADTRFDRDDAEANGSSIAFVFEYKKKRILFGADSHEETLLDSLGKLSEPGKRYKVNACKLPHHGSRRNVSKALVQALDCDQWWFSSSGARFNHPNDEAIARVVSFGGTKPKLVANYRSERWQSFTAAYPAADHGYTLTQPDDGTEGITITFK